MTIQKHKKGRAAIRRLNAVRWLSAVEAETEEPTPNEISTPTPKGAFRIDE